MINKQVVVVVAAIIVTMAAATSLATSSAAYAAHDPAQTGLLSVTYINMSSTGESILLQLPDDEVILIDAGLERRYQQVKSVLDHYGISTIDLVIATHKDADHIGGLNPLLTDDDYSVSEVWFSEPRSNSTQTVRNFYTNVEDIVIHPKTGYARTFGSVYVEVLSPHDNAPFTRDNDNSIVMLLEYGELEFLFTGDIESRAERWLVDNAESDKLDIDIMNAPHHGADTSSTQPFIDATSPELVIHSANLGTRDGDKNHHGHPHDNVIARYAQSNVDQLRTGTDGHILVQTDGTKCSITFVNGTESACFEGILKVSDTTTPDDTTGSGDGSTPTDPTQPVQTRKSCR